jgi:4-phytase/acid phosphatase/peptide/nickel transport system substrate-binding protein
MMLTLRALGCVVALMSAFILPALAQKKGGTLTVGMELDIPGFDPLKVGVFDTASAIAAKLLFDTLTRLDDEGNVQPSLALSWSHSDDFKTWTLKLRPGVKFHDGTPYNAQAVAWNYARMKDPNNHCACAFYIAGIDHVEARGELTVVYHLVDPSVNLPVLVSVPASVNVTQSPKAIAELGAEYNRHPVGTGAYVLKSWTAGDRLVLERNPDYWNKGHPHLDKIVLKPLPDSQTRFASLLAGETDVVWADEYEPDHIARVQKDPTLKVHIYAGAGAAVAAFNTKLAPFDDARVRRALVMALDRKKLSLVLTDGLARPASNPYGDGSWIKCRDDGALPTDPQKARALIQEYGKPVEFNMLCTATPRGRAAAQVLQQMWKEVGAKMNIELVDQATIAPRGFRRQFELIPWRIPDSADPGTQMFANFHSGSPVALANWEDPELDRLLEHQRSTADQAQRAEDFCAVARLVNREAIWFWTFQNTYYALTKARVKGIPKLYSGIIDVADAWLE